MELSPRFRYESYRETSHVRGFKDIPVSIKLVFTYVS